MSFLFMMHALVHAKETTVYATKIFHHRNGNPEDKYIEVGSVALYFTTALTPQLVMQQAVGKGQEKSVFFFPQVALKGQDVEAMANSINAYKGSLYTVAVEAVTKPNKGLNVTFIYDPKIVQIRPSSLLSIARQPGIIFRVLNTQLVSDITRSIEKTRVTKVAYRTHPRRVVIDPGHGGSDTGTCGIGIVMEKDLCLSVGTLLATTLKKKGYEVLLTRCADADVALDERTTQANGWNADIFISIHANAANSSTACGIETHYTGESLLQPLLVAENVHSICSFFTQLEGDSAVLAQSIQKHVCKAANTCHDLVVDRATRKSVAQVLVGTRMPSVLVELGFLTNMKEAQRLATAEYQKALVQGICDGVVAYFTHVQYC